jgi:hypothetical protein
MVDKATALLVAQPVAVRIGRVTAKQILGQNPDGIGRPELAIVLAAAQLLAVDVGPSVEDAGGQIRDAEQLDLDLIEAPLVVARLDIDDRSVRPSSMWRRAASA